jgi:hypothetical protein
MASIDPRKQIKLHLHCHQPISKGNAQLGYNSRRCQSFCKAFSDVVEGVVRVANAAKQSSEVFHGVPAYNLVCAIQKDYSTVLILNHSPGDDQYLF